jgi:glutathione S-transferase
MPVMHRIPACPFSQRVEILLGLKHLPGAVRFETVDITRPRTPALLAKLRGTTALPIMELDDGRILKESLVIMAYLEESFPQSPVMRQDVYERAVERMFIAMEGSFAGAGYHFVMNQDIGRRDAMARELLAMYAKLDAFLVQHNPDGVWLFERFGYAECVYAPMLARFQFLDYYEDFDLPDEPAYARVRRWRDACLAHPAAQQVTREEIVKVYYDYTRGCGNGSLPAGRSVSTFTFDPPWQGRPMPPRDKWNVHASDADLGLAGA